jgi:hypothetical protein
MKWRNSTTPNWNPPVAKSLTIPYVVPSYRRRFERIWWDDGRSKANGFALSKTKLKPCQHYVRQTEPITDLFTPYTNIPWSTASLTATAGYDSVLGGEPSKLLLIDHPSVRSLWGSFGDHNNGAPSLHQSQGVDGILPLPPGLSYLVERSLLSMLPRIKSEISLINSVIELKDLKRLPDTIRNMASVFRRATELGSLISTKGSRRPLTKNDLLLRVRRTFEINEGATLSEITRTGADGYLQAQFNIIPLLNDIISIQKVIRSIVSQINWLVNNQGRPQCRHFTYKWLSRQFTHSSSVIGPVTYTTGQFAGSISPPGQTGCHRQLQDNIRWEREVIVDKPDIFHGQIFFNYYFRRADVEHALLYGIYDALGINLNPAIIWNAIPWTFLLDWVVNVSSWLNKRTVLNLEPGVNITRYLWSWKASRRIRTVYYSTLASSLRKHRTYLPDIYESLYRRDIGLPSRSNSLYGSGLSDTELSLGAALATSLALRPNRRLRV